MHPQTEKKRRQNPGNGNGEVGEFRSALNSPTQKENYHMKKNPVTRTEPSTYCLEETRIEYRYIKPKENKKKQQEWSRDGD
jgi:hypothetical protein